MDELGGGKQTILGEPNLDVLLRVSRDHHVLRTPARVAPAMRS